MRRMQGVIVGLFVLLAAAAGFGQQAAGYFRIVSTTGAVITAFSADGSLVWTNAASVGVTCTVQRATTIAGPSNWVDYVQHEATNATMALRVHDANPPSGMMLIPAGSFQMGDNLGDG